MHVDLTTVLPCRLQDAVGQVMQPRLLMHVARPLVRFTAIEPAMLPQLWSAGTYWMKLTLLGFVPFGKQAVVISFPAAAHGFAMRDAGHSALVKVWNHRITITREAEQTIYRDQVDIDAGVLTPFVWLFAQVFYRHRQRRWVKLALAGFDYGAA